MSTYWQVDTYHDVVKCIGNNQLHYLIRADGEPLWLAGIWAERVDARQAARSRLSRRVAGAKAIHPRMPLALDAESLEPWLDPHLTDRETIRQVVHHLEAELITHWTVSTRVNRPIQDDASLVEPISS